MIAHLDGTVSHVGATAAVLDLSGFGVLVQVTPATASSLRLGRRARLATSMVVREDSMTLYGFATDDERDLFELLVTANGVGPKLAQAALAVHGPDDLRTAIAGGDIATLTRVPGIGRKGAERICIELRDKIGALAMTTTPQPGGPASAEPWREQVTAGLQGLGWSARDAEAACDTVAGRADDGATVAELMRAALQSLARK